MIDVNKFSQIRIGLATADAIRTWSNGEVKKPETINYRTLKPEKDGLFCEKIFGPMKDWECACGKYRRVRFKGIICERCGVEVTRSKVRRERMGHIELAAPAVHIWYLRGTRSWLAYLLSGLDVREELKAKSLEKVIYFAANLVTWVDEAKLHEDLPKLEKDLVEEVRIIDEERESALDKRLQELEDQLTASESQDTDAIIQELRSRLASNDLASEDDIKSRVDARLTRLNSELAKLRYKPEGRPPIVDGLKAINGAPNRSRAGATKDDATEEDEVMDRSTHEAAMADVAAVIVDINRVIATVETELVEQRLVKLDKELAKLKFKPAGDPEIAQDLQAAYGKAKSSKGNISKLLTALDKLTKTIQAQEEASKAEASKAEASKAEASKAEASKAEASKAGASKAKAAKAGAAKASTTRAGAAKAAPLLRRLAACRAELLQIAAVVGDQSSDPQLAAATATDPNPAKPWTRLVNATGFVAALVGSRNDISSIAEVVEAAKGKTRSRNPKERELNAIRKAAEIELEAIREEYESEKSILLRTFDELRGLHRRAIIEDEYVWQELESRYAPYFEGGLGAEAIAKLITRLDFEEEERQILDALNVRGRVARVDVEKRDKNLEKLSKNLAALKTKAQQRLTAEAASRISTLIEKRLRKLGTVLAKSKFTPGGPTSAGTAPAGTSKTVDNLLAVAVKAKGDHKQVLAAIDKQIADINAELAADAKEGRGKTRARFAKTFINNLNRCADDLKKLVEIVEFDVNVEAEAEAKLHDEAFKVLTEVQDDAEIESADVSAILNEHYGDFIKVSEPHLPLSQQRNQKAVKRLKILSAFNRRDENGRLINDPRAMILDSIPVIPPELRPMVQLDGGRFATSDLNDLYRRVINRNNRLKRLLDLGAPEIIVNNEKRMLQEAVDALFDNGRRGRAVTGPGNRPLKSLSDMLKGKQGRFRQNLLGKRVDYSGRSVIVAGPTLRLHQCGLPKLMALELFKPFVMKRLVDGEYAQNIKSAKRMVERRRPDVWNVLEDAIKEHPVLLNRAPTLHRLGIQAFEPVLVEGKAIQIHPLVCAAFNADFDGDQMAVHLPLSPDAQAEARVLMLSANNIISPADGRPVTVPSQDMIIGSYYLTGSRLPNSARSNSARSNSASSNSAKPNSARSNSAGQAGRTTVPAFRYQHQIQMALDMGDITLHEPIEWRNEVLLKEHRATAKRDDLPLPDDPVLAVLESNKTQTPNKKADKKQPVRNSAYEYTTPGRVLYNNTLPAGFPFVNRQVGERETGRIVRLLADEFPISATAASLDAIKDVCYAYASRSGLTISVEDVIKPPDKAVILERHEREADRVEEQFRRGIITDGELRQKEVEIWTEATEEVRASLEKSLSAAEDNPINMMVDSGARGNMMQVRQIAAIRGLVANPRGDIIPRPIKSSYREGLATLEYFISTPGARKGLVDTALRTADSGYLTRRLVDVAQELIINDEDPMDDGATPTGMWIEDIGPDRPDYRTHLQTRLFSRCLATDVKLSDGTVIAAGTLVREDEMIALRDDPEITRVQVLSPLTDDSDFGVSGKSYGGSLATGDLIEEGEAVGVIAAQSIGEPGTQLTMRTFHMGGVAGTDIAGGLPRVVELFEARTPRGKAVLVERSGVVRIGEDDGRGRMVEVVNDNGAVDEYRLPDMSHLAVIDGDEVSAGDPLVDGPRDPKELVEILGVRETQLYLIREVQKVYREQGVSIHDKHIELIIRQMTRRVLVVESGDTEFLPGDYVDQRVYRNVNREVAANGGSPAMARPVILGITKASLATDSWLSAASFQETTRVLTEAAIESRLDELRGLKENIIIGKLIPAGTGQGRYRHIEPVAPDYEPITFWSSDDDQDEQTAPAWKDAAVASEAS